MKQLSTKQWGCVALACVPLVVPVFLLVAFRLWECAVLSFHALMSALNYA